MYNKTNQRRQPKIVFRSKFNKVTLNFRIRVTRNNPADPKKIGFVFFLLLFFKKILKHKSMVLKIYPKQA